MKRSHGLVLDLVAHGLLYFFLPLVSTLEFSLRMIKGSTPLRPTAWPSRPGLLYVTSASRCYGRR